jgi:DNA repair protein RadA/Sms
MKERTVFTCQICGWQSPKWLGKCPDCNSWNSFVEEIYTESKSLGRFREKREPVLLKNVDYSETLRFKTHICELDRVLGGGIVKGSVILIGGDPGIGKSTISLQVSNQLSKEGRTILYVSAEESIQQTKLRANRLGLSGEDSLYIVNETDLSQILEDIEKVSPEVLIVDSIQVIFHPEISSSPGSVSQVRECAGILARLAKTKQLSVILIGHVTKTGEIAGPKVLEHIVDTVLYFEGERFSTYRILRAVKNRFGSTNEIGVFEMGDKGLIEVLNPSQVFLSERKKDISGSVVISILEGTRPILVEIQALVSKASFGYARRRSQGIDINRLNLLIAVLEKRLGLPLETQDIFVNVVGGIKLTDPASDLGLILAITSSFKDKVILPDLLVLGEVGLGSEIRSISFANLRIREMEKLGFKRCLIPRHNLRGLDYDNRNLEIIPVDMVSDALDIAILK